MKIYKRNDSILAWQTEQKTGEYTGNIIWNSSLATIENGSQVNAQLKVPVEKTSISSETRNYNSKKETYTNPTNNTTESGWKNANPRSLNSIEKLCCIIKTFKSRSLFQHKL